MMVCGLSIQTGGKRTVRLSNWAADWLVGGLFRLHFDGVPPSEGLTGKDLLRHLLVILIKQTFMRVGPVMQNEPTVRVQGATEVSSEDSETDVTLQELTEETDSSSVPGACISVHNGVNHSTHI